MDYGHWQEPNNVQVRLKWWRRTSEVIVDHIGHAQIEIYANFPP